MSDSDSANESCLIEREQEVVSKLYELRDSYYLQAPPDKQNTKWEVLKEEMNKTLLFLNKHNDTHDSSSYIQRSQHQYLLGRTRNILPDYDPKAQEHLSLSVKLNPSCVEAWNELGECYWKAGNAASAKNCFTCALEKTKNKVSLRSLSVIFRQLGQQLAAKDSEQKKKFCFDGLQMAKEAVQLDPIDSESWLILGNSYLAVAFYSSHSSGNLKKALAAYNQAEKYQKPTGGSVNSADLYYNKATALIYDEQYQDGLECLDRSRSLDPCWDLPLSKKESTIGMLRSLSQMVEGKGKLKSRKLNSLLKSTNSKDWGAFKNSKLERIQLQDLSNGANLGKFVVCKVVASVPCDGGSPFSCCVCDNETYCMAVTFYRLAQGYGPTIGDSLLVPEPVKHMIQVTFDSEVISFPCIRVDSPHTVLVNGHELRANQMAAMFMTSTTRHE